MSKAATKRPAASVSDDDDDNDNDNDAAEEKKTTASKKREHLEPALHIPKWTPVLFHTAEAATRAANQSRARELAAVVARDALEDIHEDPSERQFWRAGHLDHPLSKAALKMAVALLKKNHFVITSAALSKNRRRYEIGFDFSSCPEWSDAGEREVVNELQSDSEASESE